MGGNHRGLHRIVLGAGAQMARSGACRREFSDDEGCTPTHPQTKRFKAAGSDGEGQGATPVVLRKGQTWYF